MPLTGLERLTIGMTYCIRYPELGNKLKSIIRVRDVESLGWPNGEINVSCAL